MGTSRAAALVATLALVTGCFGYNRSAKRWSYVGDTVLVLAGGTAIVYDEKTKPGPCSGPTCPVYTPSIGGALIAGIVLTAAGLFGIVVNASRDNVKTSR